MQKYTDILTSRIEGRGLLTMDRVSSPVERQQLFKVLQTRNIRNRPEVIDEALAAVHREREKGVESVGAGAQTAAEKEKKEDGKGVSNLEVVKESVREFKEKAIKPMRLQERTFHDVQFMNKMKGAINASGFIGSEDGGSAAAADPEASSSNGASKSESTDDLLSKKIKELESRSIIPDVLLFETARRIF